MILNKVYFQKRQMNNPVYMYTLVHRKIVFTPHPKNYENFPSARHVVKGQLSSWNLPAAKSSRKATIIKVPCTTQTK